MLKHFNFMMTSSLVLPVLTFGLDLHEFQISIILFLK